MRSHTVLGKTHSNGPTGKNRLTNHCYYFRGCQKTHWKTHKVRAKRLQICAL